MKTSQLIYLIILISVTGTMGYYFYPEKKLPVGAHIDSIVVFKSRRQLLAYSNGQIIKTYKISLGKNPLGDKEFQGDKKTPEGVYFINGKNPYSVCYKNLGISYPDQADIKFSQAKGKPAGGDIKIHGLLNGFGFIGKFQRWIDWTNGCIGVSDKEMEELYGAVQIGTKIEIKP